MDGTITTTNGNVATSATPGVPSRVPQTDASDNLGTTAQTVSAGGYRKDGSGATGGGAGRINTPNAYTALHTLTNFENFVTDDTTSAGYATTLPPASSSIGREYTILNLGTSNSVTLTAAGGDTITLIGGSSAGTQTIGSLTIYTIRCALNHAGTAQWWMK